MSETVEQAQERYLRAAHAMQTGVEYTMRDQPKETTPKHLRVGVNAAMVDHGALVQLLISKGVITELEYFTAIADAMEREVALYQRRLQDLYPNTTTKITLA